MAEKLSVLSIGAGAIGTYIGGSLALQGHDVVFIERAQTAEKIRSQGLRITLGESDHHIPKPNVLTSLKQAVTDMDFDIALYALKSFDTKTFLDELTCKPSDLPPFLCLSNGVDNEPLLTTALGPTNVIAGTVTSAVGRRDAGDVILEKLRGVGIAGSHPLSGKLENVFNDAGLNATLYSKADDMKWSKMLTNLIANASSAILDLPPHEFFSHSGLYKLEILQLRETLAVMKAQGYKVVDLPGTPVHLLAFTAEYLPLPVSRFLLAKAVGGGRGGKMPSFHIDLYSGRGKSEVGYLNGAVVRAGKRLGIPTPANEFLNNLLQDLVDNKIPRNKYQKNPELLLKTFNTFVGR